MKTIDEIQRELTNDQFSYQLRMNVDYDESAFNALILVLNQLSVLLKNETMVPKALAQDLYSISNVVQNSLDWLKLN